MKYAEVAVNSPGAHRATFCYAIPNDLSVTPGQAVWVPFGPITTQGIVMALTDTPSVPSVRTLAGIIGTEPILSTAQLKLASWISEYYLCPLFEAMSLMLPPGFEQRLTTVLVPSGSTSDEDSLTMEQRQILALIRKQRQVKTKELEAILGQKRTKVVVNRLCRLGLVKKTHELEAPKVGPKVVTYIRMRIDGDTALREIERRRQRAPKQAEILSYLLSQPTPPSLPSLLHNTGCSRESINSLIRQGLLVAEKRTIRRDPLSKIRFQTPAPFTLTSAQQKAINCILEHIRSNVQRPAVFLLHGVTGSGKTEVYLHLLQEIASLGKRGICLVPEIALTPQTIERFQARFPNRVAVMHSSLSLGEQYDEWHRIKQGECDVVIGTRSALFTPQPDLGLIVIDEEHEWTYKQVDRAPRYHARTTAIKLAEITGAAVVLGSATPDVETYFRAQNGNYHLIVLPERISPQGPKPLPEVEIVDMRQELKAGNTSLFSRTLMLNITETIRQKQQVILFLNRRGTATVVKCSRCGHVFQCPKCSVTLTFHAPVQRLTCHRCRYSMMVPKTCPNCLRQQLRFMGIGTQAVEAEIKRLFPEARAARWDSDATVKRHSHETILDDFRQHRTDILIGTQMIAKGIDLPDVTLAGIINADIGLNVPDFRACERTFQLLCQVAGRAGRGFWPGRVIIQTYCPDHYAIKLAANHDYEMFYKQEIEYRRQFKYPPYSKLIRLLYAHTNPIACQTEVERLSRELRTELDRSGLADINILGPSPAPIARLRGHYRWQLVIQGSRPESIIKDIALPPGWSVDVDPIGMI